MNWYTANLQKDICIQQLVRSAVHVCSLIYPHKEALGPWLPKQYSAKTDQTVDAQTDISDKEHANWMIPDKPIYRCSDL